jgi:hypothetical protein
MCASSNILVAVGLVALFSAAAFVGGVYVGRHETFPASVILDVKQAIARRFFPAWHWRRDVNTDVSAFVEIPCPATPIVIVTGGQSNAANHLSDLVDERPDLAAAMLYARHCYRLADPLLGATGHGGSLWAALGQRIAAETGRGVIMINAAVTATTYEDWLTPESEYFARLERSVDEARSMGFEPTLLLWHEGESDAHRRESQSAHAERLDKLLALLLTRIIPAPEARLVLYRASVCIGSRSSGNAELVAAQTEMASRHARVILGPNTDRLGTRSRFDGCHLNSRGRDEIVAATMKILRQDVEPIRGRLTAEPHKIKSGAAPPFNTHE